MKDLEHFKKTTLNFINDFIDYNETIPKGKVINPVSQKELDKIDHIGIPEKGRDLDEVVQEMEDHIFPYGNHSAHPRFFGFVPSTASPLSWLGDIMTTAYNRHGGSVANQPAIWQAEKELIRWLNHQAGFPEKAGGTFVSGGSMANLTAVTIARDSLIPEDQWHLGTAYISDQTHSSLEKALKIIGISQNRIRIIPTDSMFRIDTSALEEAVRQDIRQGLKPFLAIGTCGTTNTGSVDPFFQIRKICDRYGMWMHVDGSFGASVLLCKEYRHLLAGIETADSLSWDAHKWLFQTFGCAMVLVRDEKLMLRSFGVHPEYLKDLEKGNLAVNPWDLGIELTKPVRSMKLWMTLQVMGTDLVSDKIAWGIQSAELAEKLIRKNPVIEIISPAQMAVINFRYNPAGLTEEQKDKLNVMISEKMLDNGYAGVFTTELNGKKVLRLCMIHPDTTREEIRKTVSLMDHYYQELMKKVSSSRIAHIA